MKKLAVFATLAAFVSLILYIIVLLNQIDRLRSGETRQTEAGARSDDSGRPETQEASSALEDSSPVEKAKAEERQTTESSPTPSENLNTHDNTEPTRQRPLEDFLTLIDRCDDYENPWRSEDTLKRFAVAGIDVSRLRPGKESVPYAVDQALRTLSFQVLRLDVKLHRYDKTKSSVDRMDVYYSRNENEVRIKTIPEHMHPGHLDYQYFETIALSQPPAEQAIIEVSVQPQGMYQGIYDRWSESRQRSFKMTLRTAVEHSLLDLDVDVRVSVYVWNSTFQSWQ